jgi:preprotein translocase SecF subunit
MKWAKIRTPISLALIALTFILFFTIGVNEGIDFKGGTVLEVHSINGAADVAQIRGIVDGLGFGDVQIQSIGSDNDVLIRIATQPGGETAQQEVVEKVRGALGSGNYEYRRVEVVGPRVSGELAKSGTWAVLFTIAGIMIYIWFRFEWQFGIAAVATLVHDAILTLGFFAATQIDFNLTSLAAILTIIGYSLNDTVVIFDRIRENLRRYKTMPIRQIIDLSTNQSLARTIMTSLTLELALLSLYLFGGPVVQSFTAAMIWGIFVATASSIFIGGPILIYFNIRPGVEKPGKADKAAETAEAS